MRNVFMIYSLRLWNYKDFLKWWWTVKMYDLEQIYNMNV